MSKTHSHFRLRPQLPQSAAPVYERFLHELDRCSGQTSCQVEAIRALVNTDDVTSLRTSDKLSTKFFFEVIADLTEQGWRFRKNCDCLQALPPDASRGNGQDQQEIKRRLSRMLVRARNDQLRESSHQEFIEKMERPQWHRGRQISVLDLFADGVELANDLRRRLNSPAELQDHLLKDAIDPYLQLVTDERDEHTGLRLRDIWRYCRYTWSLPYRSQPGRRMHYLVRDRARQFDPIMGIGALGSSIVQISPRDIAIGWSLSDLEESESAAVRIGALRTEIDQAIGEIFTKDFVEEEALTPEDLQRPTKESLECLGQVIGEAPLASRERPPKEAGLVEAARSPLYRRKRATTLSKLLKTLRVFQRAEKISKNKEEQAEWLLEDKQGRQALRRALRSLKKRHVGSSMMNITTCGAIPPYNPILGGKLTSLLMCSPQVLHDYQEKYTGRSSHIASRMHGDELIRENKLVLLETTSLYYVGSSQYNRLRAPTAQGQLRFNELDEKTKGFGSVHLSRRVYGTLQQLLSKHPDLEAQGYGFGNGVNYKMRSLAAGLGHVGLGPLLKHENPRLIFLIPLANNWREYLNGLTNAPELIYDNIDEPLEETSKLIEFWKERWFLMRVKKPFVLRRIEGPRDSIRVSDLIESESPSQPDDSAKSRANHAKKSRSDAKGSMSSTQQAKLPWKSFAELKDDRASYAELLSNKELKALHVKTKLDDDLIDLLSERSRRVYLTGNPGDGKTHFIERYRDILEEKDVFVETDASATSEDDLIDGIKTAAKEKSPALIAINEGPLRRMLHRLPEVDTTQLREQLNRPFLYGSEEDSQYDALLVNLGLRHVLSPEVIEGILDLVLNRVDYHGAPDPILQNVKLLRRARVKDRLKAILQLVARSGQHVTMHEVLGFFSHIITGGHKSAHSAHSLPPYYVQVYSDQSPFSSHLKELDPAYIAHPRVDMYLWDQPQNGSIEWLRTPGGPPPLEIEDPDEALIRFNKLKRQYFFEAQDGDTLLEMLPDDRNSFFRMLETSSEALETAELNVIEAISQYFGGSPAETSETQLDVWTGLRYAADGPPSVFVSAHRLSEVDFELKVPRLRAQVKNLVEYQPSHVQLRLRSYKAPGSAPLGLDIDLSLWLELMRLRRGTPTRYRDAVIERRLGRFLSRIATQLQHERGVVRLRVRDLESNATYQIGVLPKQNSYRL